MCSPLAKISKEALQIYVIFQNRRTSGGFTDYWLRSLCQCNVLISNIDYRCHAFLHLFVISIASFPDAVVPVDFSRDFIQCHFVKAYTTSCLLNYLQTCSQCDI